MNDLLIERTHEDNNPVVDYHSMTAADLSEYADVIWRSFSTVMDWEKTIAYNCPALKADNGLTILFAESDIPYAPPVWPEEPGK